MKLYKDLNGIIKLSKNNCRSFNCKTLFFLEPDLALEAYQKALNMNPKDPYLTSKMGTALVNTHHFARAIKYYKETIDITGNPSLKIDLIELYILLKQYENAEQLINSEIELEKTKKIDDLTALKYKTKLLVLLGEVLEKSGNYKGAQTKYKEARDNQNRVRRLYTVEQTGKCLICCSIHMKI